MDAVKEGDRSSLTSGRMVALAAGLSLGATVGYMVYRHVRSSRTCLASSTEEFSMVLPIDVYKNIFRCQAMFLDMEMILEKVKEDLTVRRNISQSSALRQRRHHAVLGQRSEDETDSSLGSSNNGPVCHREESRSLVSGPDKGVVIKKLQVPGEERLSPESLSEGSRFEILSPELSFQPDEHLEVYVSASENPNHFWIQILGVRSLQLDKLMEEMNHYYSNGNPAVQQVKPIVVGDIVAAPYQDHDTWNRARVLGILGSNLVDLYYVDFGDNGELPPASLRHLRSDFLSLPFQAIECSLAGVMPKGEVWTEAALDDFERLTHCARWRPLQAKLYSYSHSEVSSWPSVRLYDYSEGKIVDICEELIRLGHAVSCQEILNGRAEEHHLSDLQRMLDAVKGTSSELSFSCISSSEEGASISGSVDDIVADKLL
uniref:Tudor and KH domain containing n=1 Tax=Nothobranchius korthausae TaxID=1143690 RepID=A0A1A8ETA2_9TELE